jgi:predicted nucleic acid-binding protein
MASNLVIFDTSVLIAHLRTGCYQKRLDNLTGLLRTCSVVLAELWRGATTLQERKFLEDLARNHPVLTPHGDDLPTPFSDEATAGRLQAAWLK